LNKLHKLNVWTLLIASLTLAPLTNSYAEGVSLKKALANKALFTLLHHDNGKAGSLNIVSVAESQKNALKGNDRLAGYPINGALQSLEKEKSLQLANIFLDESNYVYLNKRCANQAFNGIRFTSGNDSVEIVIGTPCNQVLAVSKHENETQWWGGILNGAVTEKVLTLLTVESE